MLTRLKQKWQVNTTQFILIICTFALGGSLCGFAGRKLLGLFNIENRSLYIIAYIIVMTLVWPLCVLAVSVPLGQFKFFKNYLIRLFSRMKGQPSPANVKHIAIFASGAGSNAEKIIQHLKSHHSIKVSLVVCNKPGAGVLNIAATNGIHTLLIEKENFFRGDAYLPELNKYHIDFIVLAGFLWKIPQALVQAFPGKMINIHPALLPKYGGKGMYGNFVHEAVIAAGETQSGITIHFVNEKFDDGEHILQVNCPILPGDTPASLAQRIHELEHKHFPQVVEDVIMKVQ